MNQPYLLDEREQEIVRRGLASASLLDTPVFVETIKSLMYEAFCSFTETKPDELNRREQIYNQFLGLQAIEATLNSHVQAKDELERALNATDDSEDTDI